MILSKQTCCFIGHRKVENRAYIYKQLKLCVEDLINKLNITTFLFGSRSQFDDICLQVVTELKTKYPNLIRIYFRAENEFISADYENYLLESYDMTLFAQKARNAKRFIYIKRNEEMIDNSAFCVFYLKTFSTHSGTAIAFDYAKNHKKHIINIT